MVKEINDKAEKRQISTKILTDLPEWFGIEQYVEDYINKSAEMPFFAVYSHNESIGFAALKKTSDVTAEIYCMGILKAYHNQGYGKRLFDYFETYAKEKGFKYLQVKTVEQGRYEEYDQTNRFYQQMGFSELEVFPTLWDEWNPCQVFIKAI